jgi:uncharacterized RDD family membrane protein YckC
MKWYYADAGRQMGPVEERELDDLVRAGAIGDDTLVWCEGMTSWQPHASVRGAAPAPPPMATAMDAPASSFCSECGRPFPPDQLVAVGNASVCAACKPAYLQRLREGGQVAGARRYAGFWIRFVARLIDGLILGAVGLLLYIPFGARAMIFPGNSARLGVVPMFAGLLGLVQMLQLAIAVAYEAYFVSTRGGTLGKLALGLRIIRADGSPVPAGLAVGRYFAQWISAIILMIGYIMAAFDDQKRALHDRICETRVIHVRT